MKKTLVSALTTALVVGAASTTFAAANPFSDVPADHWAYDAVTQLAKDGVVDGYGDGTFRGGQEITRYEMAQIIARAMAKTDVSAADKAMIDKLAAEFSSELNNLGVRVANLEKKTDNVKWTGEVRYRYTSKRQDTADKSNQNQLLFRINPSAQVNEHWTAKARMDYFTNLDSSKDINSQNGKNVDEKDNKMVVDRIYMEGNYGDMNIKLGKLPFTTADGGMFFDERISGGQVSLGKTVRTTLTAGRYNFNNQGDGNFSQTASPYFDTASYQSIQFAYSPAKKVDLSAGFHHLAGLGLDGKALNNVTYDATDANILTGSFGYRFSNNFALNIAGAHNTSGSLSKAYVNAGSVEADYKGANASKKGSFGIWAAYRHLGSFAVLHPTYNGALIGTKGWEVGTSYAMDKNILGQVIYFNGKKIGADQNDGISKLFGQVEFMF